MIDFKMREREGGEGGRRSVTGVFSLKFLGISFRSRFCCIDTGYRFSEQLNGMRWITVDPPMRYLGGEGALCSAFPSGGSVWAFWGGGILRLKDICGRNNINIKRE